MFNFDPNNVLLAIATNIPVLLMTAFVLQGHMFLLPYMSKTVILSRAKKINKMFVFLTSCRNSTKIKIEYIWSKSHVIRDEVLCRLFNTILADAELKCKMFALSLSLHRSHISDLTYIKYYPFYA